MTRRNPRPVLVALEARDLPTFYGNQLFPLDNPWNQRITDAPETLFTVLRSLCRQ